MISILSKCSIISIWWIKWGNNNCKWSCLSIFYCTYLTCYLTSIFRRIIRESSSFYLNLLTLISTFMVRHSCYFCSYSLSVIILCKITCLYSSCLKFCITWMQMLAHFILSSLLIFESFALNVISIIWSYFILLGDI